MSHPNPTHDRENERVEDSKFAPKRKIMAKKMKVEQFKCPSYFNKNNRLTNCKCGKCR